MFLLAWPESSSSQTRLSPDTSFHYRYRKLTPEQLENSRAESLKDTAARIMPLFNSVIVPSMQAGNKCIVVSHANTIRSLVKHIDDISDEDIKQMTIPTGIPLLYRLDQNMKPVDPQVELEFKYMVEPKGYVVSSSKRSVRCVLIVPRSHFPCHGQYYNCF